MMKKLLHTRETEDRIVELEIKEEGYDLPLRRKSARVSVSVNESLLKPGGYLDSQTTETQYFGSLLETQHQVDESPPRKKIHTCDSGQKRNGDEVAVKSEPINVFKVDESVVQAEPVTVSVVPGGESKREDFQPFTTLQSHQVKKLCKDTDGDLTRQIEDAFRQIEHARLEVNCIESDANDARDKATQAELEAATAREKLCLLEESAAKLCDKVKELERVAQNIRKDIRQLDEGAKLARRDLEILEMESVQLTSNRYGRLKTMLKHIHGGEARLRSPSPIQETQTWMDHGDLAEDPYYPSLETQIYRKVIEGFEPVTRIPAEWVSDK